MDYGKILLYYSYLPSCMLTVVNAGLRETAIGVRVVKFTLKGMAAMSALNIVDTVTHWVVVALEKVSSIDKESKSTFTVG